MFISFRDHVFCGLKICHLEWCALHVTCLLVFWIYYGHTFYNPVGTNPVNFCWTRHVLTCFLWELRSGEGRYEHAGLSSIQQADEVKVSRCWCSKPSPVPQMPALWLWHTVHSFKRSPFLSTFEWHCGRLLSVSKVFGYNKSSVGPTGMKGRYKENTTRKGLSLVLALKISRHY